jgi:hypothetical protein
VTTLRRLRERLGFTQGEVAQGLGIPISEVETLEQTPFRLLELGKVSDYVGTIGCRLDVVAVHVDGEAIWLSDERGPW